MFHRLSMVTNRSRVGFTRPLPCQSGTVYFQRPRPKLVQYSSIPNYGNRFRRIMILISVRLLFKIKSGSTNDYHFDKMLLKLKMTATGLCFSHIYRLHQ